MYYLEDISIERANYILSLPDDIILSEMYDPEELSQVDHVKNNTVTYLKNIKAFCKRIKANKGIVKQTYKYSNRLGDCGRLFVKGFGIQSLQHKLRGFLCSDKYYDFDMKNAHPTILNHILTVIFPNENFPELEKYVSNREKLLKKFNASKLDILCAMNMDKSIITENKLVKRLDTEFKHIQNLFWNSSEYDHLKNITSKNKKGSLLNTILCIEENNLLQQVMEEVKISVPMFDGFLIHVSEVDNIENMIQKLDSITIDYGVSWTQKPHDTTIQIDEDLLEDMEEQDCKDYDTAKIEFEEKYFVIDQPLGFGEVTDEGLYIRSKQDFQTYCENITYFEEDKNNKIIEKPLFLKWIKDKDRRHFRKIDFIPSLNNIPSDIYNTFTGFDYIGNSCPNPDAVKVFLDHLKLLVNHEEESFIYLVSYIAHMFQKSDELPEVALLFKSQQGVGKDLMIDILQDILGRDMVYRTAKLDEIFDKFNGALKNRLLLQLNEVQGSDGFAKKENLKDLITTKFNNINEKNMKPYTLSNYMRVIIFSNNLSPIEIPHDDRRYCVFKCGKKQPRAYYNRIVQLIGNSDAMESILHYFRNYDIKDFDIKDRPITQAYEDMRTSNSHPLYKYLYDIFVGDEYHDEFEGSYHIHKKTHKIAVNPQAFRAGFKYYLESIQQTFVKHDYKTLKLLMADLDIYQKQLKFCGKSTSTYYIFPENADLLETLKIKGFVEEEIEEW